MRQFEQTPGIVSPEAMSASVEVAPPSVENEQIIMVTKKNELLVDSGAMRGPFCPIERTSQGPSVSACVIDWPCSALGAGRAPA